MTQKVKSAKKFFQHSIIWMEYLYKWDKALEGKKKKELFLKKPGNYFIYLTKWKIKF